MVNWLITGIGGGLGQALAQAALARGDNVFGTSRSAAACEDFARLAPGRSFAQLLDFTDAAAPANIVAAAHAAMGKVDRLVNNAAYGLVGAVEEIDLEDARAMFDVNLFGSIAMIQAVLPAMRARKGGHIVNITSVSGLAPWPGTAIYGASKYAMECIGQTLAQEVAPLGIRVTNVAPGGMRTNFGGSSLRLAERVIDDYAPSAHYARKSLKAGAGKEKGDPARAADAIIMALDEADPPMHLLLGDDALHYAEGQITRLQSDMKRWEHYSLSISHADSEGA